MKPLLLRLALLALLLPGPLSAQVPALVNYQGRVAVDAVNFEGTGLFRFALVNEDGSATYWSNDGTSAAGSEPTDAVALTVGKGLYSVLLGDTTLANMTAIPPGVFAAPDVRLRIWFDDGVNGSQLLAPDQRLAPAAYLADGAVTATALADGAVVAAKIAPGTIDGSRLAPASLDASHLFVPAAPAAGQVLAFDGANLSWVDAGGGGGDSVFSLNGTSAYYLDGNVGIGTSAPTHRLTLAGGPGWTSNGWLGILALPNASAIGWASNATGQRFGMGHTNGGFAVFRTAADPGTTASAAAYDLFINDGGAVGVGTLSPQTKLHLFDAASVSQRIETGGGTNAWSRVDFVNGNGQWQVGTSRSFNGDQFYIYRAGAAGIAFGIQPNGDTSVLGTMSCKVLTIRGGADLAEPFAMSHHGVTAGTVVSIDPEQPGKLRRSAAAYDRKVAGIVSGANGIHPGISMIDEAQLEAGENVALSGRVYVKANTSAGPIAPGDLLTTSEVPGEAMLAADHARAQGAILGKAMTPLDEATGLVLVLVTLQ